MRVSSVLSVPMLVVSAAALANAPASAQGKPQATAPPSAKAGEASGTKHRTVDWPMFGGSSDNTHYSTLSQITPANVGMLKVAWTYETHDEFKGSEMQTNPVVIDGVLYGTSPKLRVFALDAATGRELWSFDPNFGKPAPSRFRHRGSW